MVNRIDGYWISLIAAGFFVVRDTTDPFPPGTNVYASISLSEINTLFAANDPEPKFTVVGPRSTTNALSWELRTATSLARLWRDQHRVSAAHELLSAVRARFGEGFQTRDCLNADALLQELCTL